MKLLFYTKTFAMAGSGLENDIVLLCRALAERGHEIHVCCESGESVEGVTVHDGSVDDATLLRELAPDKTIDWGFAHAADVHRIGGGVHEMYLDYSMKAHAGFGRVMKRLSYSGKKHQKIINRQREYLSAPGSLFLPISQMVADHAVAAGAKPESVKVVYNGVDTDKFEPEHARQKRKQLRAVWGLAEEDVGFLFVAHNLKLKNLDLMIRCFRALHQEYPELNLLVCGKRKPKVKAPFLRYVGTTPDIASFYGAADVLLHPSYYDSFANVVLEAMACGIPPIVSDCCGVTELLTDGKDSIILPVSGPQVQHKWCKAIADMFDPVVRESFMPAVRQTAEAHPFSKHVDDFESALMESLPNS
jgi:glycosyltransferase involved in cell wall biosynthesis